MDFKNNLSIFLQIADSIRDDILGGVYPPGSKLASVRSMAAEVGVNPNTVMRSYAHLQDLGFISNRRGIGFFVPEDALQKIKDKLREDFIENELPAVLRKMELLDVDRKVLMDKIKELKSK